MMKKIIKIGGMNCSACSAAVERALNKLNGVSASVNLVTEKATVVYDESLLTLKDLEKAIINAGYSVVDEKLQKEKIALKEKRDKFTASVKLIVALIFTIPLFYISMAPMITFIKLPYPTALLQNAKLLSIVQLVLTIPTLIAGYQFFTKGFKKLLTLKPNMDSLVAVGTASAFIYSLYCFSMVMMGNEHFVHNLYFESSAVIITLVMLGKYIEGNSKAKTNNAIKELIKLAPQTATVRRDGKETVVDIDQVQIGDIVICKEGESLSSDGIVEYGFASVDESMLTGESLPIDKAVGDKVFAGTLNKNGNIEYSATTTSDNTALAKIIELVENAGGSKAPISKLADKISGIFVPVVISIAVISALIWYFVKKDYAFSLNVFISVMVIACPCALGLATPTAVIVGTGLGAKNKILFKDAESLEKLNSINRVVFDKTGTLTQGTPKVTDIVTFDFSEEEVLSIVSGGEDKSSHPLAKAICVYAKDKNIRFAEISDFKSIIGSGIEFKSQGKFIKIGNAEFASAEEGEEIDRFSNQGKTALFVNIDGKIQGIIALADTVKKSAADAVAQLAGMRIKSAMLTGDNNLTAQAIANQIGITEFYAQTLPHQKLEIVNQLQSKGELVAMVGDGINDAPALTGADIGIAIGGGTDVAIESADIVLSRSEPYDVVNAILISRATLRNIKQNLFWAFIYNLIGIPIACGAFYYLFGVLLNPMLAALAMSLSSVSVVLNALRLNLYQRKLK